MKKEIISIGLACDHAGFNLKEEIKAFLEKRGYKTVDFGTHSTESMDYPDTAHPLAKAVENKEVALGVAMCGSGNGISMTLNKYQGIRAALCWTPELSKLARQHNDANILSLPARFITSELALEIVVQFLETDFEGGRHLKRVNKIAIK